MYDEISENFVLFKINFYALIVPSLSLIPSVGAYNEKRVLQIGLLLALGGTLLVSSTYRRKWLTVFSEVPVLAQGGLLVVLSLGVVSSALAPAPDAAFLELAHFVLLFVAAGGLASIIRSAQKPAERLLLGAVVVGALLYAVYFMVGFATSMALPALEIGQDTIDGFVNIRFFNQYQTWTLPLLSGAILVLPRQWKISGGIVFLLVALWWALILGSDVRGTVVAMAVGGGGVVLFFRELSYPWLKIQGSAFLTGCVLYYFLFTLGAGAAPEVIERFGKVGQSSRIQHWWNCLEMAWANPWLGVGPMHYAWPPYHYTVAAHPHNALMQWLAEWGGASTLIMISLVLWGGWAWMRQEQREAKTGSQVSTSIAVSLVASVLGGAAHALVSGLIVMPVSQVFLVLTGGWAWGRYQKSTGKSSERNFHVRPHILLCGLLVVAMVIVGSSLRTLSTVEERRKAFRESVERQVYSPRYWGQGYIGVRDSSVIERARRNR